MFPVCTGINWIGCIDSLDVIVYSLYIYEKLEGIVIKNKRAKLPLKTISDLLRLSVNDFYKTQ